MTDYVTLRNDGDTKKKVNNITKENYKQLQLIASRREQKKKTKKTLRYRSFALTPFLPQTLQKHGGQYISSRSRPSLPSSFR